MYNPLRLLQIDALDNSDGPRPVGGSLKLGSDVIFAFFGLLLLLPLFVLCAIGVALTTKGPILFRHRRIGFNGRAFGCFKFRTMVQNAEALLKEHLASDPAAADEWRTTSKLRNDPRVTSFGQLMRKSSLDELPQLLNVLLGQMSLVGPRPVTSEELKKYGKYADRYAMCRPGITGVWQVSGRSRTSYRRRIACDSYYEKNWSFLLDIKVLLKTLPSLAETGTAF